uniref:PEROXIDASE_4 domain-containing protein n=1 Tax=Hymenolepis diminuta TaxID=6216 RepID=A0A0R3SLY5_HYMDI
LLSSDNVNSTALQQLTREVATFATRGGLKRLDFALNSRGEPDVAVFDFTSLSAAQYACSVADRKGRPLCQCLVGDALLEVSFLDVSFTFIICIFISHGESYYFDINV